MLGQTYRNDHGFKEFYKHISQVMKDEQAAIIKKTQFLSVLSDGSTDLSVIEEEIVYVRWVSRNHNILWGTERGPNAKAPGVVHAIETVMDKKEK